MENYFTSLYSNIFLQSSICKLPIVVTFFKGYFQSLSLIHKQKPKQDLIPLQKQAKHRNPATQGTVLFYLFLNFRYFIARLLLGHLYLQFQKKCCLGTKPKVTRIKLVDFCIYFTVQVKNCWSGRTNRVAWDRKRRPTQARKQGYSLRIAIS